MPLDIIRRSIATAFFLAAVFTLPAPPAAAHELTCTPAEAAPEAPLDLPAYHERLEHYYYSGRYVDEVAAVVAEARSYLAERLEQDVERPAMVLDIDETSLSNWPKIKALQFGYDAGVWSEWVEAASALALGPTLDLTRWARGEGVALFFITGRDEDEREATARNLEAVGYAPWTELYLEDEAECCTGTACGYAASCKAFYRKKISNQGYTIVINLGDQRSDLLGGYAERSFKLPNPFYFVP